MKIAGTEVNLKHKALEIYLSGCKEPHCPGCHNPELWDFGVGVDWQNMWPELEKKIFELKKSRLISNIWLLGGDPLHQNLDELVIFMICLRTSDLKLMLWTREFLVPGHVARFVDYVKTGPYVAGCESYTDPCLGITLANREQRVAKVIVNDNALLNGPEITLMYDQNNNELCEGIAGSGNHMPTAGIKVKKLHPDAVIPQYHRIGDAGFDLHAVEDVTIGPFDVQVVPTGLAMEIPFGLEMQIRMRSGASIRKTAVLANAPGTIDSGYRGEIGIIVRNVGPGYVLIRKGERIAQGVLSPIVCACFSEAEELSESERGEGGFGSTGE